MKKYFNRFTKNRSGKVLLFQTPNTSLWLAIVFYLIRFLPWTLFTTLSFWGVLLSLFYWSYLEIFYGVNGFRKVLGIAVFISQSVKLISLWS